VGDVTDVTGPGPGSPLGLHRVLAPAGILPQAAWQLDPRPSLWPDEVRVTVERLNLDAASFRQLREATGGAAADMRAQVCKIVAERGKMQNPVTGSGGMLTGVVDEVGPESPLGLAPGDRIATLVSLSLTPLVITDGLAGWDGRSEQVPGRGHAILFGRSIATVLPADLPGPLALAVLDVAGAPALTSRVVGQAPPGRAGRWWRSSARAARAAACPRPRPGRPARAGSSGWCQRGPRRPRCAPPAWWTRWWSRTRVTRWRWPPRYAPPAGPPR
jgi:L-erythro-3,5-diaminohexanoate dehydrogenase